MTFYWIDPIVMPHPLMYQEEAFVLLETDQPEQFLTWLELQVKLQEVITQYPESLPHHLQNFSSVEAQVKSLIDTYCELEIREGKLLQWYAVRLEN